MTTRKKAVGPFKSIRWSFFEAERKVAHFLISLIAFLLVKPAAKRQLSVSSSTAVTQDLLYSELATPVELGRCFMVPEHDTLNFVDIS
jgi:hypothetical protein